MVTEEIVGMGVVITVVRKEAGMEVIVEGCEEGIVVTEGQDGEHDEYRHKSMFYS